MLLGARFAAHDIFGEKTVWDFQNYDQGIPRCWKA